MAIDFNSLPKDVALFSAFGLFKKVVEGKQSYTVTFPGSSLEVPVSKEQYDNPPNKYSRVVVRGTLNTTMYGGRITTDDLVVLPCPENQWPKNGDPLFRFEAEFELSKDSYGKDYEKTYKLSFKAQDFLYSAELSEEEINRFPTGFHTLVGSLESYQFYNKRFGQWVTLWKAIPLGIINPKRSKQE